MRFYLPLLFVLIGTSSLLHAQNARKVTFGEVSPTELRERFCAKDSSAEAQIIYDAADVNFELDQGIIYINMLYHTRIKIYKKSALSRASVEISAFKYGYAKDELLLNIQGYTYNLDDEQIRKDKLSKEMIFVEKSSDNVQSTKFTLPNVKEGSVIEYSYLIKRPFGLNPSPRTWAFQVDIPVAWSEYNISIPNYFFYRVLISGYLQPYLSETKPANIRLGSETVGGTHHRVIVKDAPAFVNEPFITTPSDYVAKIEFELASADIPGQMLKDFSFDYSSLNTTLLEDESFGMIINKSGFMKDAAKAILSQTKDTTQMLQEAIKYIQSKIKWNQYQSIWVKNLKKVLEKGEGDAADVNLSLVCLLREMGFDANPVILSTRDHGRIHEQYALLKRFNYVVAHIERSKKDVFLDATEPLLSINLLPVRCLNHTGWLVHPTAMRMLRITPTERDVEYKNIALSVSPDGELIGTLQNSYSGYSAWQARSAHAKAGAEAYVSNIKKEKPSWAVKKYTIDASGKSFDEKFDLGINDHATVAGNLIYLKPMLTEGYTTNPFKSTERSFPIDLAYPVEETVVVSFEIPLGYQVAEAPKSVAFTIPDNGGRFTYVTTITDNHVTINSRLILRKDVYPASEFGTLKEFYDKIVAKHAEQIVLKKN